VPRCCGVLRRDDGAVGVPASRHESAPRSRWQGMRPDETPLPTRRKPCGAESTSLLTPGNPPCRTGTTAAWIKRPKGAIYCWHLRGHLIAGPERPSASRWCYDTSSTPRGQQIPFEYRPDSLLSTSPVICSFRFIAWGPTGGADVVRAASRSGGSPGQSGRALTGSRASDTRSASECAFERAGDGDREESGPTL
jgi:hypothetical protein